MERRYIKIGAAADILGVTLGTLRRWEESGELVPDRKTKGGTRYYDYNRLIGITTTNAPTICYARVSSHDQKADLEQNSERIPHPLGWG